MNSDYPAGVTPKGRPKASEAEARAEKLLNIAAEVFLESGYGRTKVSDIVQRAGASKSSIYSRYPTKSALFEAVILKRTEQLNVQLNTVLSTSEPLPLLLRHFAERLFETLHSPELRALFQTVVAEAAVFPELAENFWNIGPQHTTEHLAAALAAHDEFTGEDPLQAADAFISICLGTALLKVQLMPETVFTPQEIRARQDQAIRLFEAAYIQCRQ